LSALPTRLLIDALSAVGLYASIFMFAKSKRYERGEETGPSVVQQPRARLFGGIQNSAFGIAYYSFMFIAAWLLDVHAVWLVALAAAATASAVSVYLAYSLLFITRMPCRFCWTGHVVNWSLAAILFLFHPR
jgi:uncharacterized membrane protein